MSLSTQLLSLALLNSVQTGFKRLLLLHLFLPGFWFLAICILLSLSPLILIFTFNLSQLHLDLTAHSGMFCVICSKQYVLLSVLLCLLASGLVVFFLFPHSVLVGDDGIKVVKVTFNKQDSLVILAITVRLRASLPGLCTCQSWTRMLTLVSSLALMQATLKIRNSNFYPVAVTRLSSQVQYMNTVVGTYMTTNVSLIPPRSEQLVSCFLEVLVLQCRSKLSAMGTHNLF